MNKKSITKRQKQFLKVIYDWIKNSGFPPTFNELKDELNITSNQTILDHLANLEKKNLIKREDGSARGIIILKEGYRAIKANPLIAIVGTTSAGVFTEAIEEIGAWKQLSKDASIFSDDFMMVRIDGDSMVGAGIEEGDVILFQKANEFSSGDIVLAESSDGKTIKRFISQDKPPYQFLKPENPKYKIIPFTDDIEIVGKMVKNFKKYG